MKSPLAFDRDPLFSKLSEPIAKIDTRLTQKRQRFWMWKTDDFFWFWNEDEPDFFGVFFDGSRGWDHNEPWFSEAISTTNPKHLRQILHHQLHHGQWARAISLLDPRPSGDGIWRVLWRRRQFLLQNAFTGRAVRFFPGSNWGKYAPQWRGLNCFSHDAAFFAEMFWPLLNERRGRLETAFDFLELPTEDQKNPIRFGSGDREEFMSVLRAALIADDSALESLDCTFSLRFHHRTLTAIFGLRGILTMTTPYVHHTYVQPPLSPRIERLATSFEPYLVPGFSLHPVMPSPLTLFTSGNEPSLYIGFQGPFSAHERVESFATVRDWISGNAPALLGDWQ